MDNFQNNNESLNLPWEEQLKLFLTKIKPYLQRILENKKKWILANIFFATLFFFYILFFQKPFYEVTMYVLPDYGSKSSSFGGLGELASLAGLNIDAIAPTDIYENIVSSEEVLYPVIMNKYKTEEYSDSVNLLDYNKITADDSNDTLLTERERFLKYLDIFQKTQLTLKVDRKTKILTISVKMPESKLSADVANKIIEYLDLYIRTQRKSFASNQRIYLEKRINVLVDSLTIEENRFVNFKEKNINSSSVPRLLLEENRLRRNVELLQSVYLELNRQLELVKLDEVKDIPVLNVREIARDPVLKTGPKRKVMFLALNFFSIVVVTLFFAFKPEIGKSWRSFSVLKN